MQPEDAWLVTVDATTVSCRGPDDVEQAIDLNDLVAVDIVTTDRGPWEPDVWYELVDDSGTKVIAPQGCIGEEQLLDMLFRLPGFELKGMNSTENARFECWRARTG